MAWGLGFIEDLVGKENIAAAKNAYNTSRFKETVDDVSTGLGNLAATAENTYDQFQNTAALNRAAREREQHAANKARLEMANAVPAYAQNDAMEDTSLMFVPAGRAAVKGLGKAPKHPALLRAEQEANIQAIAKAQADDAARVEAQWAKDFGNYDRALADTSMRMDAQNMKILSEQVKQNNARRLAEGEGNFVRSMRDAMASRKADSDALFYGN